jgi:hypothetical protein
VGLARVNQGAFTSDGDGFLNGRDLELGVDLGAEPDRDADVLHDNGAEAEIS